MKILKHIPWILGIVLTVLLAFETASAKQLGRVYAACGLAGVALLLQVRLWHTRHLSGPRTAAVGALLVLLIVAWVQPLRFPVTDPETWRQEEERRLHQHFESLRSRYFEIETVAIDLAEAALDLVADSSRVDSLGAGERRLLFSHLEEELRRASRRLGNDFLQPGASPASRMGVQLYDDNNELTAWTGSDDIESFGIRMSQFTHGEVAVYFKSSGVVTFLTYDLQPGRPRGSLARRFSGGPRAVVHIPVQVEHPLQRFEQERWSLAERWSARHVDVELLHEAATIPPFLSRTDLEITGDVQRGVQAQGVIRGSDGSARTLWALSTPPYADRIESSEKRVGAIRAHVLWLVALLHGLLVWTLFDRGSFWRRSPWIGITALWFIRWSTSRWILPHYEPPSGWLERLRDPGVFAIRGFAELVSTPLDLFLTCATLFASVFVWFLSFLERPSREWGTRSQRYLMWFLSCVVVSVLSVLCLRGVELIAAHSTVVLTGWNLDLLDPATVCVLLSLLALTSALLCLAAITVARGMTSRGRPDTLVLAFLALLTAAILWVWISPLVGLVAFILLLSTPWIGALQNEVRFTSFALASFCLVALATTLTTEGIQRQQFRADQQAMIVWASESQKQVDEERPFVLQQMLEDLAADRALRASLLKASSSELSALAFNIWTRSLLGPKAWPAQVRIFDAFGALVSEFSVDMPYGRDTQTKELQDRARREGVRVELTEVETASVGRVRLYRGAVPILLGPRNRATVVVDLPFAHESLSQYSRASSAFRPSQTSYGAAAGEAGHQILVQLDEGAVEESSSPYLGLGERVAGFSTASDDWQRITLLGQPYVGRSIDAGHRTLLAALPLKPALQRLLDWSQLGSFYFAVSLMALLSLALIGRFLARHLPALLVPKRFGFQQKLMGAFLVVALLPSLVLSLATRDVMRERTSSRNRDAALSQARSAEAALADLVRREIETVRESEYLRGVLSHEETPPVRDIGHLEFSQVMVFHGDGRLILDETLSNLSDEDAKRFISEVPGRVFASRDDSGFLNLGALVPVWFSMQEGLSDSAEDSQLFYLLYRRRLTDGLLLDLAPILNTELSVFDGPHLEVSSQKSLATAGLLPSLVPRPVFENVVMRNNRSMVMEETRGGQTFYSGYLPMQDRYGSRIGVLAVSQIFRNDEFAAEFERTRSLVVGLSTLMFVLTLVFGVVFSARIFDPVRNLIDGTRRLAGGEFGFRLQAKSTDEIGELEHSFNDMAERLDVARSTLEERRRYLEAVLSNIASGVITTDAAGRVTASNAAAKRILSQEVDFEQGDGWSESRRDADHATMQEFWKQLEDKPDSEVFETTLRRGQRQLTLRVIVTDLRPDANSEPLGRVAIFEDITELIRSKKLAAWAEMARQVAHEIKNPLTPLKAEAQFMEQAFRDRSERFPEIFTDGMETIIRQVDALRRIASEFSNFGRVQKIQAKPVDLDTVLRDVVLPYVNMPGLILEFLNGTDAPDENARTVHAELPPTRLRVLADEDGLRKVFRNVLENSREAMKGEGRISLCIGSPSGGRVSIEVWDEGEGIGEETLERLYEPYFSTKSTGTGLGLAITRGILEEIGGSIQLENRPQGGARARITLLVS